MGFIREDTNQNVKNKLSSVDGVIVAPGFGKEELRENFAIKYVRENNIPEYVLACNVYVLNSVETFK